MIRSLSNYCYWYMNSTIIYWTSQINVMMLNGLKKLMKECLHSNTWSIIAQKMLKLNKGIHLRSLQRQNENQQVLEV